MYIDQDDSLGRVTSSFILDLDASNTQQLNGENDYLPTTNRYDDLIDSNYRDHLQSSNVINEYIRVIANNNENSLGTDDAGNYTCLQFSGGNEDQSNHGSNQVTLTVINKNK